MFDYFRLTSINSIIEIFNWHRLVEKRGNVVSSFLTDIDWYLIDIVFILKIVLGSFAHWTLFWYQVLVVCLCWFWINECVSINMKFCVMEDKKLKKREESFLDSFVAGFSYKKHSFSRSAMFTKIQISCFFYSTSFKISLFLF